ncbi:glycosyltransferase family 33 protein [Athelia psychrophila]|uniref:Chitobiosyldiphosphodolichol beta-mannosyltransferase n=1 Tax=Athelia psychrophila TaxID=1759441 RepID=A0A166TAM0_9AGAM|nr:glycosyltransferase family 33 protein [Fibularhizoctonia sp. CBS 109695]
MMYHAESFAKNKYETFLIGYRGSKPSPTLLSLPHIHFLYLSEPPKIVTRLPFILAAPIKIIHQICTILAALMVRVPHPPEFIMVQNPPSIPTLALVWLVGRLKGSKVIIDWHNLGYSILALKLGPDHIFVRLAKKLEATFGRSAYAHLFVTNAMHDYLVKEWDLQGHKAVLHDRPPSHFHSCSPQESHELFLRLEKTMPTPTQTGFLPPYSAPSSTPFTSTAVTNSPTANPRPASSASASTSAALSSPSPPYAHIQPPEYRADRPALLVSSTSWTPDEDFGMLLEALAIYEQRAREVNRARGGDGGGLPKVLMIVTGKGPLKARYVKEMNALQSGGDPWKWVRCITLWLEAEDYPTLLGCADLGISLHSSSSALDLPMKVVDMFGCGLPVCALDFACLHELVKDGTNGLVFTDAAQLAQQIEALLSGFPNPPALTNLRRSLVASSTREARAGVQHSKLPEEGEHWEWNSWSDNWNAVVRPLISRDWDSSNTAMEGRL